LRVFVTRRKTAFIKESVWLHRRDVRLLWTRV
jgi:hypothetical protein